MRAGWNVMVLIGAWGCAPAAPPPAQAVVVDVAPAPASAVAVPPAAPEPPKSRLPRPPAEALMAPELADVTAPDEFRVAFETTTGRFEARCVRALAPHGADRLYNLVQLGYFDDVAFFRAIANFMVQFGIHGDPTVAAVWKEAKLPRDRVQASNRVGTISYAQAAGGTETMTAPNRTTQLFINLKDNGHLDRMGFAPLCEVVQGMDAVARIDTSAGSELGRKQRTIEQRGNAWLRDEYPQVDFIVTARVVE